jgi:uncharacterized coiled-coil protein SlyX
MNLLIVMVLAGSPDAGSLRTPDAGPSDAGVQSETSKLAAAVDQLKSRMTEFELKVAEQAKLTDSLRSAEIDRLRKRISDLETKSGEQAKTIEVLTKRIEQAHEDHSSFRRETTEREEQRKNADQRSVEQRQKTELATKGLIAADQQLSSGATNIDQALRAAEATYSGAALQYIQAARSALTNGDLATARRAIGLAVIEAQNQR